MENDQEILIVGYIEQKDLKYTLRNREKNKVSYLTLVKYHIVISYGYHFRSFLSIFILNTKCILSMYFPIENAPMLYAAI